MKKILFIILLFTFVISACQKQVGSGILKGTVTISPCTMQAGEQSCEEAAYSSIRISVFNSERTRFIKTINVTENGTFQTELPSGRYNIDMSKVGIRRTLPQNITITSGQATNIDVFVLSR